MSDSVISWTVGCQAPLSSTISQSLLKFMSVESVMLPNHLIFCHSLLLHSIWSHVWDLGEKVIAPHSGTLAWKIPWMEEPGRLQSMRSLRV